MVNISKLGDSTIKFTFTDNDRYLYNGEITLPLNSLILEFDTSDLVIFKKIDGDVFVTFLLENSNFNSKAELESWYKANMVGSTGGGGGGVTPEEVEEMIDEAVSGKVDTDTYSAYTASTTTALFGLDNKMNDIEPKVNSAWTKGVRDLLWYPTSSGLTLEYNIMSGGTYQFAVQPMDESLRYGENAGGVSRYLGVYASGNTYNLLVNKYNNTAGGYRITFPMAYKASKVTLQLNSAYTGQTPTTNAIQAYYYDNNGVEYNPKWNYNSGTDSFTNSTEYTGITLAYDQITKIVTLTLDSSYNYIRGVRTAKNFADENNLTNPSYYIGAVTIETNSYKLQEALDNKQDQLVAGENITISGNVISATGGGSLNIPISAGTGTYSIQENAGSALGGYSHAEGSNTTALGDYSHAEGSNTMAISAYSHTEGWQTQANGLAAHAEGYTTKADGEKSHAEGNITETKNLGEHASGSYNLSHKASNTFGDSGNTLFSVGNGTSNSARHNAFEIRQNGDIYFEYDGNDIKLQDKLDEIESVTAAALNNLNNRFGGLSLVKLTQTEYDNLQTKDSNVLYIIVN